MASHLIVVCDIVKKSISNILYGILHSFTPTYRTNSPHDPTHTYIHTYIHTHYIHLKPFSAHYRGKIATNTTATSQQQSTAQKNGVMFKTMRQQKIQLANMIAAGNGRKSNDHRKLVEVTGGGMKHLPQNSGSQLITVNLETVLNHFQAPTVIDYLSIDVDGREQFALKSFNFTKYSFKTLSVTKPSLETHTLLTEKGYRWVWEANYDCVYMDNTSANIKEMLIVFDTNDRQVPTWDNELRVYLRKMGSGGHNITTTTTTTTQR